MASCHRKDGGARHMYPPDQAPYTVPYTGSAAVRAGSGYVASGKLVGPSVVRTHDGDIIDTSNDPGHDLAVATGARVNVPDHSNTSSYFQTHRNRQADTLVSKDGDISTLNTLGNIGATATAKESRVNKTKPTSTMQVKKRSDVHQDATSIMDAEICDRIAGLKGIVAEAKTTESADSVEALEKCIREWQATLEIREKGHGDLGHCDFVEVDETAPSAGMGHSVSGLADQIDEEKNTWAKFCSEQVKKALSLEAALPAVIRGSLRTFLEKAKNTQKAGGNPGSIAHDGNVDFDASEDCEIVDRKEVEEPWELV